MLEAQVLVAAGTPKSVAVFEAAATQVTPSRRTIFQVLDAEK
jgi:hypothetical protein